MRLVQTIQTSYEPGSYVLDGCLCSGNASLALSISDFSLRFYDAQRTAFLFDLKQHTKRITDVVATMADPSVLYSSQEDTGVMVTDLRAGAAVHFLNDMRGSGAKCSTISIDPRGGILAVAVDNNIHLVEKRTWRSVHTISDMHLDEITRMRFVDDTVLCSAGDDQMINFVTTDPAVIDEDALLQAINCGEAVSKMSCFNEVGATAMIGTCENGYICPYDLEKPEVRYDRPDYNTYLVDWCMVGGRLKLVYGRRDDDGNAGPMYTMDWEQRIHTALLPTVHKEIGRVALGVGDRLITGGEDGMLAFWQHTTSPGNEDDGSASISSSSRGVTKARAALPRNEGTASKGSRRGKPY